MNGQGKDDEIAEGIYTAQYWEYDSRLCRRWNLDPKPVVGISEYACFANNPILFTDVLGDTSALFKSDGTFWKFQVDGSTEWRGVYYQNSTTTSSVDANGNSIDITTYTNPLTFQFNDPSVDVQAIKNKKINMVTVATDNQIDNMIEDSGVNDPNNQGAVKSILYAKAEGAAKMDYGVQNIKAGNLKTNSFYLVKGAEGTTNVGYNVGDYGNFLWGHGMNRLGIDLPTAKTGAHYNNFWNGRDQKTPLYDFGPGTYGDPGILDSDGDQRAINAGHNYNTSTSPGVVNPYVPFILYRFDNPKKTP
jgi:hypothetical protein